jgi:hypothetical protein
MKETKDSQRYFGVVLKLFFRDVFLVILILRSCRDLQRFNFSLCMIVGLQRDDCNVSC